MRDRQPGPHLWQSCHMPILLEMLLTLPTWPVLTLWEAPQTLHWT